ncbi:MAG: N-acetylmuramic acid 6-phosphate etherase [Cohaesibacter sp.]|nr:N-acetylmuramic acid 6-phosphate etherase [Cohaesibacter sp.]MCV6600062.1 N-acetylmuramic acid 6-phosphate etherase [Cohaesibacter sp.]
MVHTEDISPRYKDFDLWDDRSILTAIWDGQMAAIASLQSALPALEQAACAAVSRLQSASTASGTGRLAYIGAGTSGLLAMQDAMELPPTFGWPMERLLFLMAGGDAARLRPVGLCEDDQDQAQTDAQKAAFHEKDVAIVVAASGSTPYSLQVAKAAKDKGALVIAIANNAGAPLLELADHGILLETGAEVLAGSTRMAAGTAQRATLTAFSTLLMTRLGHVVNGRMVNLIADNEKLQARAAQIVTDLAQANLDQAKRALADAKGDVKLAILLASKDGMTRDQAQACLQDKGGNLRLALQQVQEATHTGRV